MLLLLLAVGLLLVVLLLVAVVGEVMEEVVELLEKEPVEAMGRESKSVVCLVGREVENLAFLVVVAAVEFEMEVESDVDVADVEVVATVPGGFIMEWGANFLIEAASVGP